MARLRALPVALVVLATLAPGAVGVEPGPGAGPGGPSTGRVTAAPLPAPPGRTTLLSVARGGGFPDDGSIEPAMSADGRWVAFTSIAGDLVANDEPDSVEVFLLDRDSGQVRRVGLPDGVERDQRTSMSEPAISADGRIVAYTYRTAPSATGAAAFPSRTFVIAWDRVTREAEVVSLDGKGQPAGGASQPSVSADGRFIAYTTTAAFDGDPDDGEADVLRYDRRSGRTVLVSGGFSGKPISGLANAPSISGDGNLVAFASDGGDSVVNADTGSGLQVYVRNIRAGRTDQVSVAADGRPPRDDSREPAISQDGRYVAFVSLATNLTAEGGGGLFRRDLRAGRTILVSVTPAGEAGNGAAAQPSISADGNHVAWTTTATNLVPETVAPGSLPRASTRLRSEVVLRDIAAGETILVSVTRDGGASGQQSFQPSVAGAGRYVAFASPADSLVRRDDNETYDVFLRDLPPVPAITPATLDLGARAVGTESLPLAATLSNGGWTPLVVDGATIAGAARADFRIVADGCAGRTLRRDEACTVTVAFTPSAQGTRSAQLRVADDFDGSPRTVRLRGEASLATLELDPPIGNPGIVTIAEGSGFPPSTAVSLEWSQGITPTMDPVVTDARGRFRVPVLVFHNDRTGPRDLVVAPLDGVAFPAVSATMLVTKPPVVPPRFEILRIIDVPLVLVFRG